MLRAIAASTGIQLLSLGLQLLDRFIVSAVILRAWGVVAFESWVILFAAAGLFGMLDFGLYQTLSNAYTRAYQAGDKGKFSKLMALGVGLNLVVGLGGFTILAVLVVWGGAADTISSRAIVADASLPIFVCVATATIVQTATACLIVVYRAQARFARGLALETLLTALRTFGVFFAVLADAGPLTAALIYAGASLLVLLALVPLDLSRDFDALSFRPRAPSQEDWRMLGSTAPYFYVQHATALLVLQLPTLVLGTVVSGAGAVAVFLIVRTLMNFARTLLQLLTNSISVELARLHAAGTSQVDLARQTAGVCRLMCVINGAIVGGLWAVSDALVYIWSDGAVVSSAPAAIALGLGLLCTGPYILTAAILNLTGHEKVCAISKLANAVSALLLCLVLTLPFGVTGVAIAMACGEVIGLCLVLLPQSARLAGSSPLRLSLSWLALSGLNAGLVCAVVSCLLVIFPVDSIVRLALLGLLAVPAAALVVFAAGLCRSDRRALRGRLRRLFDTTMKQ